MGWLYVLSLLAISGLLYFGVPTSRERAQFALVAPALFLIFLCVYISWRVAFPLIHATEPCMPSPYVSCPAHATGFAEWIDGVIGIGRDAIFVILLAPVGVAAWIGSRFGARRRR